MTEETNFQKVIKHAEKRINEEGNSVQVYDHIINILGETFQEHAREIEKEIRNENILERIEHLLEISHYAGQLIGRKQQVERELGENLQRLEKCYSISQ